MMNGESKEHGYFAEVLSNHVYTALMAQLMINAQLQKIENTALQTWVCLHPTTWQVHPGSVAASFLFFLYPYFY